MSRMDTFADTKIEEIFKIVYPSLYERALNMLPEVGRRKLRNLIIRLYDDAFDEGVHSVESIDPEDMRSE